MNAVELVNINKSFNGNHVLKDFSIQIKKGEMVAITGNSGSGKTTILNIIGLIEKADSGTVNLFDLKDIKPNTKKGEIAIRKHIGYLFQNFALIDNETVEDNLIIGLKYVCKKDKSVDKIKEVLKEVGLSGYEKRKIYELSGGEQQRVAIARIMLKPSNIILADEPTGSLDSTNRDVVIDLLRKINATGKTVLIVTHDSYVADQCQRVINIR